MNLKGTSYINRIKNTLPHLNLSFTDEEITKAKTSPDLQPIFDRCSPQDDDEKDQLTRAYLRDKYIRNNERI